MRIGFDAKRAFQNGTGLGHYSRTLLDALVRYHPGHEYILFAPKITDRYSYQAHPQMQVVRPETLRDKTFPSIWRSQNMTKDLVAQDIDLYHGLSHEIPAGIQHTNVRSVVTIHDIIFERYPHQYAKIDRLIYRKKFKHACKFANRIIAISEQTKRDLIEIYQIDSEKIDVCYQSCNPRFDSVVSHEEKEKIRNLYSLPQRFFLSVGSIIERKNLLNTCKAVSTIWAEHKIPLVVIGEGGEYKKKVLKYIEEKDLKEAVYFLSDTAAARQNPGFTNSAHFPVIYQMAEAMIYPSEFEGFGIPVLEALFSGLPVITSNVSCMPEAGGDAALYVNPADYNQIASQMLQILQNEDIRKSCIAKGKMHAQKFTPKICADRVMEVYQKIML